MRYMPVDFLKETHMLAQPIYDTNFNEQLLATSDLTTSRIKALKRLGYYSVYIRDEKYASDEQSVTTEMLRNLYVEVAHVFTIIKTSSKLISKNKIGLLSIDQAKHLEESFNVLMKIGEEVILYLLKDRSPNIHLFETKSIDLYSIQHAVHTSIYAVKMGLKRNLNMRALKNLFIGAILHDIGYMLIHDFDTTKIGLLNESQKELQSKHAQFTVDILNQCNNITSVTKTICLQHHEKEDGTGYPNRLDSKSINPLTKLLAISITYDALTSDRPFRPAYPIHKAIQIVKNQVGTAYDSLSFELLEEMIVPFPIGTVVKINNELGTITSYETQPKYPVVVMEDGQTVKLTDYRSMSIGLNYRDT
ncbi:MULTISPECIES: HD-GYP domain-containing protein [unclassified Fusibacter]|uniref:HD-GYP domain-containing protein n=1 Tax=unclassified Fusibacter TaxID=2624464 RepID=UPI0010113F0F|nr:MULTISPECIES: HD domain-containing phosphohydrolase [unclassified Fusibacter]MCK8060489.1 HD domain-containing protein [Fusibacter sp. A2]NPE20222.1 HD domain-containing protein [Fusibacter sp. A1]RXV63430.1 HD domain-containing protein [Fusibacter sp. A1]